MSIPTVVRSVSKAQALKQAVELLATTGIPEPERRANSYAHQLSGGDDVRVTAVIQRPQRQAWPELQPVDHGHDHCGLGVRVVRR